MGAKKKAEKPRASKVRTSWMKKQSAEKVKKTRRRAWTPKMKEYTPSEHPLVNFLKEVEEGNGQSLDHDTRTALIAGFQAGHCTPEKFNMSKEIARLRLPDGSVKKTYACDVCGFVGSKVTQT
jgi:hypothetical protein